MLATGTMVAGYRIDGILGRGGMGVVYEATQISLDRKVALKLIAPEMGADHALQERFRREALRQAAIDHPHIVTVHEAGETEYGLYFAMRLVRGPTLKQLVGCGELDAARTLRILTQVADALDTAHEAGLIHRDVKPQNILVGSRDHAYLADFGLTKAVGDRSLTRSGGFVGTLDYVAPEQIRGEPTTARTDVYALGAVLYECLTGAVPYPCDTEAALLWAHVALAPPRVSHHRPDLPAALDGVISRALAKKPEARFATAGDLLVSAQATFDRTGRAAPSLPRPSEPPREAAVRVAGAEARTVDAEVPRGRARVVIAVVLAGALTAGGYVIASGGGGGAGTRSLAAGSLRLQVPDNWRRTASVPVVRGLDLASPAGASPDGTSDGALVAGMADGTGPTLLPAAFLDRLPRQPAGDDIVTLGRLRAYRYRDLGPSGLGRRVTIFVVPTAQRVATVACLGSPTAGPSADCEKAAATLALDGVRALPLGARAEYAKALNAAIGPLNASRDGGRTALASAGTPSARASAAEALAQAFARAASALAAVSSGPAERPAHVALLADVRSAAAAYTRLKAAARRESVAAFNAAAASIRGYESRIERDLRALGRLGYSVR